MVKELRRLVMVHEHFSKLCCVIRQPEERQKQGNLRGKGNLGREGKSCEGQFTREGKSWAHLQHTHNQVVWLNRSYPRQELKGRLSHAGPGKSESSISIIFQNISWERQLWYEP